MNNSESNSARTGSTATQPAATAPGEISPILDCWNRTGAQGDGTCAQLDEFLHCRNCPTYVQAGTQALNRHIPPGCRQEWTNHYSAKRKPAEADTISVLIFCVGPEWLALPTPALLEVAEQRPVHSIPHQNRGVIQGIVNMRGELLVCVSIGRLIGLPTMPAPGSGSQPGWLIVSAWRGSRLVFAVDNVQGVHRFHPELLTRPGTLTAKAAVTLTEGAFAWNQCMVGLLNPDALFSTLNRRFA